MAGSSQGHSIVMLSFTFLSLFFLSIQFFFLALQRHPFPWSSAKKDGKTKVCVECEVEGRGFSIAQWSLVRTRNHQTQSVLARLGKTRSPQSPSRPASLLGVDWSFTRHWRLQDTVMWSVFLLFLGAQKLTMYSFFSFFFCLYVDD